jgi:AcrR family transcriptional regulator
MRVVLGPSERRRREREELRGKILAAARELFTASGYEAVTMRAIAEKIEYSPTAIYLHFRDKDALLGELCSTDFLTLASRFQVMAAERDPLERLKGIGRAFVEFALGLPNHYRMIFMTPHPPVGPEERRIEQRNPVVDAWAFLEASVAEAQRGGLLRSDEGDPGAVAQVFFAGLHGVMALHLTKGNDPWIAWRPVRESADRMIEALIRGFAAPEAVVSTAPVPRTRPSRRPTRPTGRRSARSKT